PGTSRTASSGKRSDASSAGGALGRKRSARARLRMPAERYYVYVIELAPAARRPGSALPAVYVGQSALDPEVRFSQHLTGYKSAGVVRRYGRRLRPDLFER